MSLENSKEYSTKILQRVKEPKHLGDITKLRAEELSAKLVIASYESNNGDSIKIYWLVNMETKTIIEAKFQSFSSGILLALNDMMIELCLNKSVEKASKITKTDVEFALRDSFETPAMPIKELYELATNFVVLKKALLAFNKLDIDTLSDDYVVCDCARVTLGTIKEAIINFDLRSVEDIQNKTKAGIFCKSCIEVGGIEEKEVYLVDILDYVRKLIDEKDSNEVTSKMDFENVTKEEKLKIIEDILDEDIRPMLVMDGGNMEIIDLVESAPHYDLYIRYLGACSGCSSGSMGTLYAIESILQGKVSENIRVLPI